MKMILGLLVLVTVFTNAQAKPNKHKEVEYTDLPFEVVTFSKNVKPILENRCSTCHYDGSKFLNLLQYSVAFSNGIKMRESVTNGEMPLNNLTGISDVERYIIRKWVNDGMKY